MKEPRNSKESFINNWRLKLVGLLVLGAILIGCTPAPPPRVSATETLTPVATMTDTSTSTVTATATRTATATATSISTETPQPSSTRKVVTATPHPVTEANFVFTSSGVNLRDNFLINNPDIFPFIHPKIFAVIGLTGEQQAQKLRDGEWVLNCDAPIVISAALNDMINGVSGDESFDKGFIPVRKAVRQQCSNTRLIDLGSIPVSDLVPIQDRHRQFDKRLEEFVKGSGDSVYFPASNAIVVNPDGTLRPAFVLNDKHANQAAWKIWGREISEVVLG